MNNITANILVGYAIALINQEGFDAIHVTHLIPPYQIGVDRKWTQFPKLDADMTARMDAFGVTYDQPSGWFRRKK